MPSSLFPRQTALLRLIRQFGRKALIAEISKPRHRQFVEVGIGLQIIQLPLSMISSKAARELLGRRRVHDPLRLQHVKKVVLFEPGHDCQIDHGRLFLQIFRDEKGYAIEE